MAVDLVELRKIAQGGGGDPLEDNFERVLAAQSLVDVVRYLKTAGRSNLEATKYLRFHLSQMLLWSVLYVVLGAVALAIAAMAGLAVFGISRTRPSWSRWLKLPLMLVAGYFGIFLVPFAALLLGVCILLSCFYLIWGNPGPVHRAAAKTWCFVPGVLQQATESMK